MSADLMKTFLDQRFGRNRTFIWDSLVSSGLDFIYRKFMSFIIVSWVVVITWIKVFEASNLSSKTKPISKRSIFLKFPRFGFSWGSSHSWSRISGKRVDRASFCFWSELGHFDRFICQNAFRRLMYKAWEKLRSILKFISQVTEA